MRRAAAFLPLVCGLLAGCADARSRRSPLEPVATVTTGEIVLARGRSETSPDGDTVRFMPDRRERLCGGSGCPNGINLRLASLDALTGARSSSPSRPRPWSRGRDDDGPGSRPRAAVPP